MRPAGDNGGGDRGSTVGSSGDGHEDASDPNRARTLLVAGTASHVGKSTVVAGLCRRLADAGLSVAPFKAQNMSNNAHVAPTPDGDWGELGVSQFVQARAARIAPTTDLNPVLLKPRGDGESQLVIDGEAVGHFEAGSYYDQHWERAQEAAIAAYERLAADYDVIVAEGAGSIAEINLHDRDLANVETARAADASILLLGDIERGGVFASLYGTLELMPADLRERVTGAAITKFRGDESLLASGIEQLEARTGVPVVDVLPYNDPGLPEEDSAALPAAGERGIVGDDDGVDDSSAVTVGVPRLPRVSNVTDFDPLASMQGVRVAYLPLTATLDAVDAVVLPGTKNTVDDLLALHDAGFGQRLAAFDGPVIGVCGGYQMLGERITNASVEGTDDDDEVAGFGLLPVETRFSAEKAVRRTTVEATGGGPIPDVDASVSGYEIHMGDTVRQKPVAEPFEPGSAARGSVLGTYLHDLFATRGVREAFVDAVYEHAGHHRPEASTGGSDAESRGDPTSPYDAAAALVAGIEVEALIAGGGHELDR